MFGKAIFRLLVVWVVFGAPGALHAQFGMNCEIRQLKINLISPGLEYEAGLGVNSTLDFRFSIQPALDPSRADPYSGLQILPAALLQYRLYHNFNNRSRNGRFIYGNSGNYLAPTAALFTSSEAVTRAEYGYAGLVYGLQRSFGQGLSFSLEAGAGYHMGPFRGGIYPVVNIALGWIVSEKRWCVGR